MRQSSGGLRAIAALAALAAAASPAVAMAKGSRGRVVKRPDLVVSKGSVRAADGKLTGSFVVKNAGSARAGRSSAALTVRVSKKNRALKRFSLLALSESASLTVKVSVKVPKDLPAGSAALRVCADSAGTVRERSESNNCRSLGKLKVTTPTPTPPTPASSVPTDPIPFAKDTVFTLDSAQSNYWIYVPTSYDSSHATPTTLFVWMHGCGGQGEGDIYTVSPGGDQSWISIALGGRENGCWDVNDDQAKVLAAIAGVKSHFNVNPRRVIVGGYSSGGDLAYRTAFYNASMFAGVLAENTSPFRDTGSSQSASLAAAAWKFNVVHLAHTGDTTYPIAEVRSETDAMKDAGFPITRIERPGEHYDANTDTDLQTLLLPHLNDGWLSP